MIMYQRHQGVYFSFNQYAFACSIVAETKLNVSKALGFYSSGYEFVLAGLIVTESMPNV